MGAGESNIISSSSVVGVDPGVGDVISIWVMKGSLCGRGETSIISFMAAGEDSGIGGVVTM